MKITVNIYGNCLIQVFKINKDFLILAIFKEDNFLSVKINSPSEHSGDFDEKHHRNFSIIAF